MEFVGSAEFMDNIATIKIDKLSPASTCEDVTISLSIQPEAISNSMLDSSQP